jgi:putative ABC transport system permease protein
MLKEQLLMALDSLRANKFRSLLTMLGIIIGAATLVAVLSLGNALQGQVFERFIDLGTRRIAVQPGDPKAKGARDVPGYGLISAQDYTTLERLVARNPELFRTIVPEVAVPQEARFGTTAVQIMLVGTSKDYNAVQTVPLLAGRFLTQHDQATNARVGVVGSQVAEGLFGKDPIAQQAAIGQQIEINGQSVEIVGIIKPNGGPYATDGKVYAPLSAVRLRLVGDLDLPGRGTKLTSILIGLQSEKDVGSAEALITAALRDARSVSAGLIDDFQHDLPTPALGILSGINGAITGFIALVAGISLVVGGIGIMNIMLVAVTERTLEIGVRKALGATDADVLGQFVLEAMAISLVGGVIGVSLAIGLVLLVGALAGFAAPISWMAVLLALLFASGIGSGFGFYPARRAALLLPIEALRYE